MNESWLEEERPKDEGGVATVEESPIEEMRKLLRDEIKPKDNGQLQIVLAQEYFLRQKNNFNDLARQEFVESTDDQDAAVRLWNSDGFSKTFRIMIEDPKHKDEKVASIKLVLNDQGEYTLMFKE